MAAAGSGAAAGASAAAAGGAAGADTTAAAGGGADTSDGGSAVTEGGAPQAGAGGTSETPGGAGSCAEPKSRVGSVVADTWIDSAKPVLHGNDEVLSVVSGAEERRALLELALPVVASGAVVLKATLTLTLQANADADLVERELRLHQLDRGVDEMRATWTNWGTGMIGKWQNLGGDFGTLVAEVGVPAGSSSGALVFDVTAIVSEALAGAATTLPLIVLESSASPPAPAELSLSSQEGPASGMPALIIEFCEP